MAVVSQIEGVDAVIRSLDAEAKRQPKRVVVAVGYTAKYALFVHENREMKLKGQKRAKPRKGRYWDPQGKAQAGYLETPAREKQGRIGEIVQQTVQGGGTLQQGLVMAGLFLQRESQMIVPVDTGNLKGSAFTKVESIEK